MRLDEVALETKCTVIGLQHETEMKRRLLDLGIMQGAVMEPILAGAFHGMRAYRIKGTTIALRNHEANSVEVTIKK